MCHLEIGYVFHIVFSSAEWTCRIKSNKNMKAIGVFIIKKNKSLNVNSYNDANTIC